MDLGERSKQARLRESRFFIGLLIEGLWQSDTLQFASRGRGKTRQFHRQAELLGPGYESISQVTREYKRLPEVLLSLQRFLSQPH